MIDRRSDMRLSAEYLMLRLFGGDREVDDRSVIEYL